jgi:glutamyl-tRNA synthetase
MEMTDELKTSIRKWAIKNAADYKLAIPGKVIGKIFMEFPEMKNQAKDLMTAVREVCTEVNNMDLDAVKAELGNYTFEEKKKEEDKTINLPDAIDGQVITRFPPEPSGFLHVGHAKAIFLNYEGAKRHNGQMRLRIDDTNPAKAKQEYVDSVFEYLKWLEVEHMEPVTYSSDYMEKMYEQAQELILKGKAYVCTCKPEEIKYSREKKERCLCSACMPEEAVIKFKQMISGGFKEGQAILRYKGDMKSDNTTMRDPALFRIVEKTHFRQGGKYVCWPSYDFCAPILDSIEDVTHAMRSKEYELREELYYAILDDLGLRKPKLIHFSRLAIQNAPVSKRLITPLIDEGKVSGLDDPRLPTLAALKRRAILPEAIKEFVLSFGLSKVESEPDWSKLLAINKKMIDPVVYRKFFVSEPIKVYVEGAEDVILHLNNHPQKETEGTREMTTSNVVYIPKKDAQALEDNEVFRLKDWCNIQLLSKEVEEVVMPDGTKTQSMVLRTRYVEDEGIVRVKCQWIADSEKIAAKVIVAHDLLKDNGEFNPESLETVWGWAEKSCNEMELREVVQFERFGFVVLDDKRDGLQYLMIC